MYDLAGRVNPEQMFAIARLAFAELALAGYTAVGEFHYLHHGPDGTPYDDRIAMSDAVVRAAREAGLRITLLRVLYQRGGYEKPAEGAQLRYCDEDIESAFEDVQSLRERFATDSYVRVGLAAHSVRAVSADWIKEAAAFTAAEELPFHMHVAEQPREIEECLAEHKRRPVELLDELGALSDRFVAVHATHLSDHEIAKLGAAHAFACICRTTERDLGDGLPRAADLRAAGVRLCTGVDSHAIADAFEEARAVELDDRTRTLQRQVVGDGRFLLDVASRQGYAAIGLKDEWSTDEVALEPYDASIIGAPESSLEDAIIFGASPRAVRDVSVGPTTVVRAGGHPFIDIFSEAYLRTARDLLGFEG
jgi:formiminoglutamate deiminase